MLVVSFFGTTPGALMRTVSRLTIGVSSGLGGRVMRTVSFFGEEGFSAAGLDSEGSSSAIFGAIKFLSHPRFGVSNICAVFLPASSPRLCASALKRNYAGPPCPQKKGRPDHYSIRSASKIRALGFFPERLRR
jgi:hypothetical protein